MIRLISCLAFCTFCLFPSILNVLLFPFVIVWIFTWCFFLIVFIVVAWCPITLPAISALVSMDSTAGVSFGVVVGFWILMLMLVGVASTVLSFSFVFLLIFSAMCLAHVDVPLLLRWYPSRSIMSRSLLIISLVISWWSLVPSSIALYFITSLLSFSVVNIGGICMIHTTAPFSSRFWMVSFMFLYICFALDPCLISFVPVWISIFIPSMFSPGCASDPAKYNTVPFARHRWLPEPYSRVWCRVFRTNIAQNHKLINNFHKRNSKLWQQICFCTQWDYWKNHGDKCTWEIMKLMTVCVCAVPLGWLALVMRHW